jgi:hypothetical protein
MEQIKAAYPIDHWSYSSMVEFSNNRQNFKKRYILKIYDDQDSPTRIIGKACHAAAAAYLHGATPENAVQAGLLLIHNIPDTGIDWGKTGSLEKILKDYHQAFQHYTEFHPKYGKVLDVEKTLVEYIEHNGVQLALPAKAILDMVEETPKKDLQLRDHKFVGSFTDEGVEHALYFMQAMFGYFTALKYYGRAPVRMIFDEYKVSKNKDGGSQHQEYVIEFEKHPQYFTAFLNLYDALTREIAKPDCLYLPNFKDLQNGDAAFVEYVQGLIGFEQVTMVQHKTAPVVIQEARFVESTATATQNANLPAEEKLRLKLAEFGAPVQMEKTHVGASVTLYTMKPSRGVSMKKFEGHAADMALALEAKTVRVQAPIPGTNLVGVEVPNKDQSIVPWDESMVMPGTLNLPIGQDVYGNILWRPLDEMPHLLVAGATGAGKSVFLNVALKTLAAANDPEAMRLILIDMKRVELTQFNSLPHLLVPTITEDAKAVRALKWLTEEMERRYAQLESAGCRSLGDYNAEHAEKVARIVVVIDEFADLMLNEKTASKGRKGRASIQKAALREQAVQEARRAAKAGDDYEPPEMPDPDPDVEDLLVKLAQKARAVGIHLVICTQRPDVKVVTGRIKANLPTRIAFMTASSIDSRVILDQAGAEQLIGRGDMLLMDPKSRGLQRLQALYA